MNGWRRQWQAVWTPPCLLCGETAITGRALCTACVHALPVPSRACPRCAEPNVNGVCGRCQRHPPAFVRAIAAYLYASPIDRLLLALKFHGQLHIARALGELLATAFAPPPDGIDVVVPVPLHPSRLRERGYNQALELARPLAQALALRLDATHAVRTRATLPQTELPPRARAGNVRAAFAATNVFAGKRIAIFDDVMTTGQTLHSLAQALRSAGAVHVEAWVVARA